MIRISLTNIEELEKLIADSDDKHHTFITNLEKWKAFYNDCHLIVKQNILNPKLFTIIKFLLEQEKGEIFQYFHSTIIAILNTQQQQLTFQIRDSKEKKTTDIEKLFINLANNKELCKVLEQLQIEDTFGSIKGYTSKTIDLYTVDSLIMVLHDKFFELPPEVVRKTLDFITENMIILQSDLVKNNSMNKDLIFQYLTKILPLKQFIGEDLKDDKFLNQIKKHQLKDKDLLIKIFKNLDYKQLLEIFDDDLSKFLKFLDEVDYVDIGLKYLAVLKFFDKLMEEEEYLYLLDLIIDNNYLPLWKKYLDDEYYNKILLGCLNIPITSLTSKQIIFLLTTDFKEEHNKSLKIMQDLAQGNFMIQCSYLVRKGTKLNKIPDFNLNEIRETLYKIHPGFGKNPKTIDKEDSLETKKEKTQDSYLKGYDIDINTAVELLRAVFRGQIKGSPILGQAIIRSIGTYLQEQIGIDSNGIYFYDSKYSNGQFEGDNNTIGISHKIVRRLVDNNQPISVKLKVFDTLPHEIKHNLVNQNQKQEKWDISTYEKKKEMLIRKYAPNFYETNYLQFKEEIDARIAGANGMQKLVELFLPEYLDEVQDELIKKLEKEKASLNEQDHNRSMEFLEGIKTRFQLGFDTLVRYNPNIIEENPILKLEYHSNGQPKTYEEIWLGRTEENKDLIDGILKLRYPEPDNQVLTK